MGTKEISFILKEETSRTSGAHKFGTTKNKRKRNNNKNKNRQVYDFVFCRKSLIIVRNNVALQRLVVSEQTLCLPLTFHVKINARLNFAFLN